MLTLGLTIGTKVCPTARTKLTDRNLSTSILRCTEFKFKQANTRRPKPKPQPTLRDRKTLAYLGVALLATVAAPKVINDVIALFDKNDDTK